MQKLLIATFLVAALAGCLGGDDTKSGESPDGNLGGSNFPFTASGNFTKHVIPVIHYGHGLYEPTIDVGRDGAIYVSAHSTGVDIQGAPAFASTDDGKSWYQMAIAADAQVPLPAQGATPPPSDEIFIVAGDNGQAWGVDITLVTYPVHGWCDNGKTNCYLNENAYDRQDTTCAPASLNDRPWAAYANNTLLMVNNPGGGPVQVAAMPVPPARPVDAANPVDGPQWNMCAGTGGGIPGIPDLRDDGFFAVPQQQSGGLRVVTGYASDVMTVEQHHVMPTNHRSISAISNYGQVVFDANGTMFVSAMANNQTTAGPEAGGIRIATSTNGINYTLNEFRFDQPIDSLYIDGNKFGEGALVNWGQLNGSRTDYYFGHLYMNETGHAELVNVMKAVDQGPRASRHVQGAALGPDGRAYMVMSEVSGNDDAAMAQAVGTMPMSVVVQQDGPVMPAYQPHP